ncbi:hypothetical protein G6F65_018879 [Rhizopus arrhizus]|nr:hypothetical protein G6F65_018879 [Rhizopus arrhizus]
MPGCRSAARTGIALPERKDAGHGPGAALFFVALATLLRGQRIGQVAQDVVDVLTTVDRIVVVEVQLRHVAQLHGTGQVHAQAVAQLLQAGHGFSRAFRHQRGDEHLGMGHVAGDFHVGHAHRGQPVLAHGVVHQGAEFTAQLGGDTVGSMESLGHAVGLSIQM